MPQKYPLSNQLFIDIANCCVFLTLERLIRAKLRVRPCVDDGDFGLPGKFPAAQAALPQSLLVRERACVIAGRAALAAKRG